MKKIITLLLCFILLFGVLSKISPAKDGNEGTAKPPGTGEGTGDETPVTYGAHVDHPESYPTVNVRCDNTSCVNNTARLLNRYNYTVYYESLYSEGERWNNYYCHTCKECGQEVFASILLIHKIDYGNEKCVYSDCNFKCVHSIEYSLDIINDMYGTNFNYSDYMTVDDNGVCVQCGTQLSVQQQMQLMQEFALRRQLDLEMRDALESKKLSPDVIPDDPGGIETPVTPKDPLQSS